MMMIFLLVLYLLTPPESQAICTPKDKAMWIDNKEFTLKYMMIAESSWGVKKKAIKGFEKEFQDMSEGCRECHVNMIECGAQKCLGKCGMKPKSEDCHECIAVKCMDQYKMCLGVSFQTELPIPPYLLA
jgi:hypothetical protein